MKNRLICIIGPDGVGKTTQVKMLIDRLRKEGINCEYKWLRFHHFFSLPLLGFARLMGLSEVKTLKSGGKIGYHYFYRSKAISSLYPIFLLIDTLIFITNKIYIPMKLFKKTIVCDRFVYDAIVDLMISTGNYEIYKSKIGKLFLSLIPQNSRIIMLIANEEILRKRREDVMHDTTLNLKIKLYKKLADEFDILTIDAGLSIEEIQKNIENITIRKG